MKETIARLREMRDTWSVDNMYEALRALPKLLDYIEVLEKNDVAAMDAAHEADLRCAEFAEEKETIELRCQSHIKKLERREDKHCRQIEKLTKDNALLRKVAKASIRMWNGGWDKEHQEEIEGAYSAALKAAEAAMETKPESLYPSNDVMYTKGEG